MKNEGWTMSELAGELMARGLDIDDVDPRSIGRNLNHATPDRAARAIERGYEHDDGWRYAGRRTDER